MPLRGLALDGFTAFAGLLVVRAYDTHVVHSAKKGMEFWLRENTECSGAVIAYNQGLSRPVVRLGSSIKH